jgi:hypothetical protein
VCLSEYDCVKDIDGRLKDNIKLALKEIGSGGVGLSRPRVED